MAPQALVSGPARTIENLLLSTQPGLAWMQQRSTAAPEFKHVELFTSWRDSSGNPKVPSEISYSKGTRTSSQNGHGSEQHKLVLHWTKLELETRRPVTELETLQEALSGMGLLKRFRSTADPELGHETPRHLSKSPTDVVKDFLWTVSRQYYTHMKKPPTSTALSQGGVPLDIVLTHPAVRCPFVYY